MTTKQATLTNKKAVLYARVSSDRQEKEGFSIPAQKKLLREYAFKNGLHIVGEFVEAETAKRAGRTEFNNMIKFLKKNKNVKNILVEKTDRLYRNLKDYVIIDELENIAIHFVKEGNILSDSSKSQDKFMHGIRVLMAKNYIDNLSEEVRKGLYEKAEQGYYPHTPPFGYKTEILPSKKKIVSIDETTAPYIKKAFDLYATGRQTYKSVAQILTDDGFRPNGHICTDKNIERILNNPFYIGVFKYRGKLYTNAHHAPLIEKDVIFYRSKITKPKNAR